MHDTLHSATDWRENIRGSVLKMVGQEVAQVQVQKDIYGRQ